MAIFHIKSTAYTNDSYESRFVFPEKYYAIVRDAVGDWIIYHLPMRRAGKRRNRPEGYFAAAYVASAHISTNNPGYCEARLEQFLEFPKPVPSKVRDGPILYFEDGMLESDGSVNASLNQQGVRAIADGNFYRIIEAAFGRAALDHESEPTLGLAEDGPAAEERTRILTSRSLRDRAFRQLVGHAYGMTCAMTGISMRAPDQTYEVESAHIMPVEAGGPDSASNGIALSRCVHWMFDKGLLSIDADYRILKSRRYFETRIDGLLNGSGQIALPKTDSHRPHPDYLRYHRENVFRR
ncbi:HNH endonuclease [Phyllobacterium lublinensis]|uniref:HNH endonuclease n=1 Tax=Phyllobacterium lublinensis TaxID=2875708 RepID=UPI001CCE37ED|nr:HNH endonuclease [Phyllobacterium sp. 2063]